MAHARGHRRSRPYRNLRSEVPSIVAVLAMREDFAAMRSYRSFTFDDYAAYLRHVEELLRTLAMQRVHTRVAPFDPAGFAAYCHEEHLDPDTPRSRTLYTAEIAGGGPTVPYRGQPCAELLPLLRDHRTRQAVWNEATRLLAGADHRRGGTRGAGTAALGIAAEAVDLLLDALGPGVHHVVCSISTPGPPLLAVLHAETAADDAADLDESALLLLCAVLAAGLVTRSPGGLVARTTAPSGPPGGKAPRPRETVRGWCVQHGWLTPLTEAEVFSAYCTHADTGDPVPPEPGVDYRAGIALPRPRPAAG